MTEPRPVPSAPPAAASSSWKEYALSAAAIAAVTAAGWSLVPENLYQSVGLVYLLAIILLSLQVGRGPVLMAGILSAFVWEYVFIPPHFSFAISSVQDGLLFGTTFVVSLAAGQLIARARAQAAASEREKLLVESEKLHRALLDSVSHELRTPLAVISASTESLAGANEALRGQLVEEIGTAARRLNRVVGNLLGQSRLESGRLKPQMEWCDAGDIANAALESARDALAGHPLEIALPPDLPLVKADFALTEHLLANLLLNAGLHTPPETPVSLSAGLDPGQRRFFFRVADRGPGFPPGAGGHLFRKFARGDAARSPGLGLGLSIVQGFAAAQGGEVAAGENPGGGAVVTVWLPYGTAGPVRPPAGGAEGPPGR